MKKLTTLFCIVLLVGFALGEEPRTAEVKKVSRDISVKLVGNLLPVKDIMMDSEVGGLVEKVHVDTGDAVKKGDVLITMSSVMIDSMLVNMKNNYDALAFGFKDVKPFFAKQASENTNELFLGLKQASIDYAFRKKEFERVEKLFKKGAVAESDYDGARNGFDQAAISLLRAETAVSRQRMLIQNLRRDIAVIERQKELLTVRAPFTGKIVDVYVEVGEKASGDPGGNFLRIVDDSHVEFKAGVPEEYYGLVKKGSAVSLSVPGQAQSIQTKIQRISPVVNASGRTFEIEIEIDNSSGALKPGLFCRGEMTIEKKGLAVDSTFVQREENGDFVTKKDGTRMPVKIEFSPEPGEFFITGEGLEDGMKLIRD